MLGDIVNRGYIRCVYCEGDSPNERGVAFRALGVEDSHSSFNRARGGASVSSRTNDLLFSRDGEVYRQLRSDDVICLIGLVKAIMVSKGTTEGTVSVYCSTKNDRINFRILTEDFIPERDVRVVK